MLKELLGVVEKTNTRPLLVTFFALSMATASSNDTLLTNPFSWQLILLPFAVFLAYGLVWGWVYLIHSMNSTLADNGVASWGPMIGSTILAFCLLVTFSYLSSHPQGLMFSLLGESGFIQVCSLFLLAAETIKIHR